MLLLLFDSVAVIFRSPVGCFSGFRRGTAVYTSSWVAPKADVHSQQRFFYMGQKGEISVDQAHRGYTVAKDGDGFKSVNPLFMKYTPTNGEGRIDVSWVFSGMGEWEGAGLAYF